jgi:hypothetical protein
MMIVASIIFGLIPLAGVVWIVMQGSLTTVDGLFTTLILLTLSGILFLNVFLGLRKPKKQKAK